MKFVVTELCRTISCVVRWKTSKDLDRFPSQLIGNITEKVITDNNGDDDDDDYNTTRRIVNLSKTVMEYIDDNSSSLPPDVLDFMIRECLLKLYRIPSVIRDFQTQVMNFFDWWRNLIKGWIKCSVYSDYNKLGWRHLAAMIQDIMTDPDVDCYLQKHYSLSLNGKRKRSSSTELDEGHKYERTQSISGMLREHLAVWILEEDVLSFGWSNHNTDLEGTKIVFILDYLQNLNKENCDGTPESHMTLSSVLLMDHRKHLYGTMTNIMHKQKRQRTATSNIVPM